MGGYIHNLLYVCLAPFDYGFDGTTAVLAAGSVLLGAAAQFFLLSKKKRIAWLPVFCAAAAWLPSVLLYLALRKGLTVPFLSSAASDLIVYAAVGAVYSLPGMLAGWLMYLAWNRFRLQSGTNP